jgi:Ala-tRNA(Pro) deacylase
MLSPKVTGFLKEHNIKYNIIEHPISYTSQKTAEAAHISGKLVAKSVIINVEGTMKMVVLPANETLDLEQLMDLFNTRDISLAHENDFISIFKDCEAGGIPPFGNLYGMEVYVRKDLTHDEVFAFNGGDHTGLIRIRYMDYEKLVHPFVIG